MLPFLRAVYYIPIQKAFGYDNIQMGVQTSGLGGLSLLAYFPGAGLLISFNADATNATANALGVVFTGAAFVGSGAIVAAAVYVLAKRMLEGK